MLVQHTYDDEVWNFKYSDDMECLSLIIGSFHVVNTGEMCHLSKEDPINVPVFWYCLTKGLAILIALEKC